MPAGKRNPVTGNLTENHHSLHCNTKLVGFFAYFVLSGILVCFVFLLAFLF